MFLISTMLSFVYLICAIFININWINDIACYFGYFLSIYLVLFIALIPGFIYIFMLISLLWNKKEKKTNKKKEEDVTILIPMYNAKKSIKETIESITEAKNIMENPSEYKPYNDIEELMEDLNKDE